MSDPLHVLFVARAETLHARRWIHQVAERGARCSLAAVVGEGERDRCEGAETVERLPVVPLRHPLYLPHLLRNILALKRTWSRIGPDLVHAHFVEDCGWLAWAAACRPWGVTAWGSDLLVLPGRSRTGIGRWLTGRTVRAADFVTAPSEQLLEAARGLGASPSRTQLLLWGVDRERFRPHASGPDWRRRLEIPEEEPMVLSPRRMEPVYRIPDIVEAWRILKTASRPGVLVLATDGGSLEEGVRKQVERAGLTGAVRFLEGVPYEEMPALFAAADLTVSVPESDGTPMSVLESMAAGTPVIVTDLPSLRPWVREGETGRRVAVGEPQELAGAVEDLLERPGTRERLGEEGIRLIEEKADQSAWMDRAVELYRETASGRPGA
ncbi:MAG: glycosyltransferase [bacterium]